MGLSKLARVVDVIAKIPQLQERMSKEIADVIEETAGPAGVAVVVEAEHMCMIMRGIKKVGSKTATTIFRGEMKDVEKMNQVLTMIKK